MKLGVNFLPLCIFLFLNSFPGFLMSEPSASVVSGLEVLPESCAGTAEPGRESDQALTACVRSVLEVSLKEQVPGGVGIQPEGPIGIAAAGRLLSVLVLYLLCLNEHSYSVLVLIH